MTAKARYSTTFGTRKKFSTVAGALATMSAALPPSVTLSCRFFIAIGVTDVIGSTPVDIDLVELLDETQNGVELAGHALRIGIRHGNAGKVRDALHGLEINGHAMPRMGLDIRKRL